MKESILEHKKSLSALDVLKDSYSLSTNFRLKLIETSARGVDFSDAGRESQQGGLSEERRRDHGSNLARMSPKVP